MPGRAAQSPGNYAWDEVVWRDAETGRELARSARLAPVNSGTMVEPGYGGRMYYLAADGNIVELNAQAGANPAGLPNTGGENRAAMTMWITAALGILLLAGGWALRRRGTA